jgi:hypothetical protein
MMTVCQESLKKHINETFYSVALYTSGEYLYLVDTISTTQGLQQVAQQYLKDKFYRKQWKSSLEVGMAQLKWSPCDSPYHCEFEEHLAEADSILNSIWAEADQESIQESLNTCKKIHDTCIAVLLRIRAAGIFDENEVVFNLLMGDQSDEECWLNAELLNSDVTLKRFRSELEIDEQLLQNLRETRWVYP